MKKFTALTLACSLLSGAAWSQDDTDEVVLLMNMTYKEGRWLAQPETVLPCGGPSKPDSVTASRSFYQLKSRDGRVLLQRYIANPRVILVEDPREPSELLKETRFTLRVPINQAGNSAFKLEDVQAFEYFENARETRTPSTVVRFEAGKDLATLARSVDPKSVRCTLVDPSAGRLPPLTVPPSTAISPDTVVALIEKDRESLIRWGLDNDLTPTELRVLVSQNERRLAEIKLDRAGAEKLLQEYEAAYRRRQTLQR